MGLSRDNSINIYLFFIKHLFANMCFSCIFVSHNRKEKYMARRKLTTEKKSQLIGEILLAVKAGTKVPYSDGDLFIQLAFMDDADMINMCNTIGIRI